MLIEKNKENILEILRNEAIGIYLFVFFVPINTKILPFILLLLFLEQIIKKTPIYSLEIKNRLHWKNPGIWMFLFYFLHIIGLLYSENMRFGVSDIGMKASLAIFPVFFLLYSPKIKWRNLVFFLILGAVFSLVINLFLFYQIQLIHPESKGVYKGAELSHFYHRGYWAVYLLIATFFALQMMFQLKNKLKSFFYFLLSCFIIYGAILTESKMGLIILFLLVIWSSFKLYSFFERKWLFILASILLLSGVFSSVYFNKRVSKRVESTIRSVKNESKERDKTSVGTNDARLFLWESSLELIGENFWLGVGTGDVKDKLIERNFEKGFMGVAEKKFNSHNQFFNSHIALGVFGAFFLLMIFVTNFFRREADRYYSWRIGTVFILFLATLTESTLEVEAGIIPYAFFLTFLWSFRLVEEDVT